MDNTRHSDDFPPLTINQIRDLAAAVREDFQCGLSQAYFTESLLMLLEDIPGFETGEVDGRLIESAWATYNSRAREF
ncbi:hypothetical protein BGV67_05765 [Burkholderia ubonensis]|uniref:hypothetical protein n=1 Tax=Burkholderia ubonensis TaxID=101571 RepID=UPI00075A99E9|nr:hypothetical protein [Burkholderia ubonensis]KVP99085.1 hypothetical protein WJ97_08690 [Burkholderia ubonensis]OJA74062.1 hypothetical protein BGV67_05765 [Burkholderia ubonensis]OJB42796.1 hypothetical protein BGV57_12030 [Burkholderia ubonensis]